MYQTILLQAGGGGGSLMFLAVMIAVMYFFFFRPQMKRQKEDKKFREAITKGQRVVTTSGIHGKILSIDEHTVVIESENSRLKFERSAISNEASKQYMPAESKDSKKDYKKEDK